MNPIILYRKCYDMSEQEITAARSYFDVETSRMKIPENSLVICRYSCLPYFKELEDDVLYAGSKLINTTKQHNYVADLKNWVYDIKDDTPETWYRLEDLPNDCQFVLKGATNSKKQKWSTEMFAANKAKAIEVHSRLCDDAFIGYQDIYIRRYVPLKTYTIGLQGLPITKEFRFFVLNGVVLSGAYYWSGHVDDLPEKPNVSDVPMDWLTGIIAKIGDSVSFYCVDVAETADGRWIVIELNEAQMSGLSENDPEVLYRNMRLVLDGAKKVSF